MHDICAGVGFGSDAKHCPERDAYGVGSLRGFDMLGPAGIEQKRLRGGYVRIDNLKIDRRL